MKKVYMALLAAILIFASSYGQKGKNQIGLGGELCLPSGTFSEHWKTGMGISGKGLLGIGTAGQMTFTTGYCAFRTSDNFEGITAVTKVTSLLLGYRHNMNGFFVEPQAGYGIAGARVTNTETGDFMTESGGAFTWAVGIGYEFVSKLEVGARYQVSTENGDNLSQFALRLGYNFTLGSSKK